MKAASEIELKSALPDIEFFGKIFADLVRNLHFLLKA